MTVETRGREAPAALGWTREQMAARAALDIPDGSYVNLGIGIPEMVARFVPEGRVFVYHTENGLLGMGPPPAAGEEDPELINAGKKPITVLPGGSFFHHAAVGDFGAPFAAIDAPPEAIEEPLLRRLEQFRQLSDRLARVDVLIVSHGMNSLSTRKRWSSRRRSRPRGRGAGTPPGRV